MLTGDPMKIILPIFLLLISFNVHAFTCSIQAVLGTNGLYCQSCPDAPNRGDSICEVPDGTSDGMCGWTIVEASPGDVNMAYACDESEELGCKDINPSYCIRLLSTWVSGSAADLVAYKVFDADGYVGDIYIQYYIKVLAEPSTLTNGTDIEVVGISQTAPDVTGDYTGAVYTSVAKQSDQYRLGLHYHTSAGWQDNWSTGTITYNGSDWYGVRLHIHNDAVADADYLVWSIDFNNDGTYEESNTYSGSITLDRLLKYSYVGQGDLSRVIDVQLTGLKFSKVAMPAACAR